MIYNLELNSSSSKTLSVTTYLFISTSFFSIHINKTKFGLKLTLDFPILIIVGIHLQISKLMKKPQSVSLRVFIGNTYILKFVTYLCSFDELCTNNDYSKNSTRRCF